MKTLASIEDYQTELTNLRRDIHAHPEIAFEEHRTAKVVADKLRTLGIEVETGIAGTGVVAAYNPRRRTKELWDTEFKLEVSHWKAAIVKLPARAQLDSPIKAHREAWRQYEDKH